MPKPEKSRPKYKIITMKQALSKSNLLLLIIFFTILLSTSKVFAQNEIKPGTTQVSQVSGVYGLDKGFINYPAPPDIKYLNGYRNHFAYSSVTHSYNKEYLKKKYHLIFKLPPNIIKSICFTRPPRTGPDGKLMKPETHCEFFSPALFIKNTLTGWIKQIPITELVLKTANFYSLSTVAEGLGEFEIRLEQTFPGETAFRQKIKSVYIFSAEDENEEPAVRNQHREEAITGFVNQYKEVLGKTTSTPIYKFSANYDFLVAAIGDSYSSGEGNPMQCGKDLPESGLLDPVVEMYKDFKNAASNLYNGATNGDWTQAITAYYTIVTLSPAIEQIIGSCTITTANLLNIMAPNFDVPPLWIEDIDRTNRSYINPSAPATFQIQEKYKGMAVTYLNYASSGATSEHLYKNSQHDFQKVSQIDELAQNLQNTGNREIDALVMAIGANDISFSEDVTKLIGGSGIDVLNKFHIPFIPWVLARISGASREQIKTAIESALYRLDGKFDLLDRAIKSKLKVKKVFLMEYPNAQFTYRDNNGNIKTGPGCGVLKMGPVNVETADAELITEMGNKLNAKLKSLAEKYNWVFVSGATDAFNGHGYCTASNISYYRSAEASCGCQGNYQGMLHPNLKGFTAIKPLMLNAFERQFSFEDLRKAKPSAVGKTPTQ